MLCRLFKKHDGKDENAESLDCVDVDQSDASPPSVVKSSTEDPQSEPVTPNLTGQPNIQPLLKENLKLEELNRTNDPLDFLDHSQLMVHFHFLFWVFLLFFYIPFCWFV